MKIIEFIRLVLRHIVLLVTVPVILALLVLILERTQMVGILKALGSSNLSIRKVFLYNAGYLVLKGLFWGNLIGLTILFIQKYFGLILTCIGVYFLYLFWKLLCEHNVVNF